MTFYVFYPNIIFSERIGQSSLPSRPHYKTCLNTGACFLSLYLGIDASDRRHYRRHLLLFKYTLHRQVQ